jgi:hypothetical protein
LVAILSVPGSKSVMVSWPPPFKNTNVSVPVPPVSESVPAPPARMSLPSPPLGLWADAEKFLDRQHLDESGTVVGRNDELPVWSGVLI